VCPPIPVTGKWNLKSIARPADLRSARPGSDLSICNQICRRIGGDRSSDHKRQNSTIAGRRLVTRFTGVLIDQEIGYPALSSVLAQLDVGNPLGDAAMLADRNARDDF
jgi:hypothetical protein